MTKKIRLGIVGFGRRGSNMFELCVNGFEYVIPAAICELQTQLLEKAKKKFPAVEVYNDFETMLEEADLDAVLIETPADNHAKFCALALDAGINVFSDIPSVDSLEEADMLWRSSKNSSAMFMTGANPNFWGFVEKMVELHKDGMFGRLSYMEAEYIHDIRDLFEQTPWRRTYPPIKYCTHSLGPLLRILDEDLKYVSCFSTGSHINKYSGQQDLMTAHFRTESGVVVRLTCSFVNNAHIGEHSYRVFGTEGYFERNGGCGEVIKPKVLFSSNNHVNPEAVVELPVDLMLPEHENNPLAKGHGGADYAMFDAFFKALINDTPSPLNLREGLRMTIPGIYAAESAARGGEVLEIKYPWSM
jgi:predicted dehydrogenase